MSKTHFLDEYLMNPTHAITVSVIGAGGNGSQVLNNLAKINASLIALGKAELFVVVYDDDIVELSNIGRQQYSHADIGRFKAEVLITRLNRFYGTNWEAMPFKFDRAKPTSNIIISCVDTVKSRIEVKYAFNNIKVNHQIYNKPFYWLDFGNGKDYGQFILGSNIIKQPNSSFKTVSKLKTVLDMFPDMHKQEDINEPSCSTREALMKQDLFINSTLVDLGMNLLWRLLIDCHIEYQGAFINLRKMNLKQIEL